MKPKFSRRQLLGTSIAAGALNLSGYVPSASAVAANYRWRPPSDRKRRALIASARFGRLLVAVSIMVLVFAVIAV